MLTARHALEGCRALYILKDGQVARAERVAISRDADLALVRSAIRPYLAATFAADPAVQGNRPVFAASYEELRHMPDRTKVLYNGFAVEGSAQTGEERFLLFSEASYGASGSSMLNGEGLVIGLVVGREAAGSLSGQSVVGAVSEAAMEAFLRHAGVSFQESGQAQISPLQARAPRAA